MINPAELLRALLAGQSLGRDKTRELFLEIMSGTLEPAALGGILVALAAKGESADELVGAAEAMRAHVTPISVPDGVDPIDTCGTGGTASRRLMSLRQWRLWLLRPGLTVAKHGNRSTTRPSGSAEGLAALGINVGG
jgi:anthranilate phosphoribosyltransferase